MPSLAPLLDIWPTIEPLMYLFCCHFCIVTWYHSRNLPCMSPTGGNLIVGAHTVAFAEQRGNPFYARHWTALLHKVRRVRLTLLFVNCELCLPKYCSYPDSFWVTSGVQFEDPKSVCVAVDQVRMVSERDQWRSRISFVCLLLVCSHLVLSSAIGTSWW